MKLIHKPESCPPSYQRYLDLVPDDQQLIAHLQDILHETEELVSSLSEEQLLYRYSEGKWTIKDILLHLVDCERVISYRAMRVARADKTNLPVFDVNSFVEHADATSRSAESILNEMKAMRAASLALIDSFSDEALDRVGSASNLPVSARLLANHICGHHIHHLNVIKEHYLK
ncbi:DinB superfamily protein [compost metagenome]